MDNVLLTGSIVGRQLVIGSLRMEGAVGQLLSL